MFRYENITLEEENVNSVSLNFLTRANLREMNARRSLPNDMLTSLVRFAKTRRHNDHNRSITSVCSKCNRKSFDSSMKCKRWDSENRSELQPFCEILGSHLCNDCISERTKNNHISHLPSIFSDYHEFSSSSSIFPAKSEKTNTRKCGRDFQSGRTARANTPELIMFSHENITQKPVVCSDSKFRSDIERLSLLPVVLQTHRHNLNALKKEQHQNFIDRRKSVDLKTTLNSTLSSSLTRYLVDVNPAKLVKLKKKSRVPCNTPFSNDMPINKQARPLDVISLAQKLQMVYRERYLPATVFFQEIQLPAAESLRDSQITEDGDDADDDYLPEFDNNDFNVFNEEEVTYKKLTTSPPEMDSDQSRQIRKESSL